jgi:Immunoglobulin domain/Carboxypeptidase regulatory-like domain
MQGPLSFKTAIEPSFSMTAQQIYYNRPRNRCSRPMERVDRGPNHPSRAINSQRNIHVLWLFYLFLFSFTSPLSLKAADIDFGNVPIGTTKTLGYYWVWFAWTGRPTPFISTETITGANASDFSVNTNYTGTQVIIRSDNPTQYENYSRNDFLVSFTPARLGAETAQIDFVLTPSPPWGNFTWPTMTGIGTVTVTGHVTNTVTSKPIAGAFVQFGNAHTTTDAKGQYSIDGISDALVAVTVSKPDYVSFSGSKSVPSSNPTTIDFLLDPNCGGYSGTPPSRSAILSGSVHWMLVNDGRTLTATFTPQVSGLTLQDAACLLGYDHFNWYQRILHNPYYKTKSAYVPYSDPPEFELDSVSGTYTKANSLPGYTGSPAFLADAKPFYWNERNDPSDPYDLAYDGRAGGARNLQDGGTSLWFEDTPQDYRLKPQLGEYKGFVTVLVGVKKNHSFEWLNWFYWNSNYNGTDGAITPDASVWRDTNGVGGISGLITNVQPSDIPAAVIANLIMDGGSFSTAEQPTNQVAIQGSTVTFGGASSGPPPLIYQWYRNGQVVAGATNATLTITNVTISDAGDYVIVVNSGGGSLSSSAAWLTVLSPPTVVTPPQTSVVLLGSTGLLSVTAGGTPPFSYQWLHNGARITGATNSTFTVGGQFSDTGTYQVIVSNAYGGITSVVATITIAISATAFSDDFESATLSNWIIFPGATALTISTNQNQTAGGTYSASVSSSYNRMYHSLNRKVWGPAKATFWIFDNNPTVRTESIADVRSYTTGFLTNGSLVQLFGIGPYSTVTMSNEVYDVTKYQGRIVSGSSNGWFNVNKPGVPSRSYGWHKFEIELLSDQITVNFYVDGILGRQITGATVGPWDTVVIGSVGVVGAGATSWQDSIKVEYFLSPPTMANLQVKSGSLTATLLGLSGWNSFVLQSSSNLHDWLSIRTNPVTSPTISITNAIQGTNGALFFRTIVH